MSGTLVVRPIQANLNHDKDILGKMDPYCIVHLGQYNIKGQVCKSGGRNPQWGDTITVQRNYEKVLLIELKDHDRFSRDDSLGVCHIDLSSLPPQTPVSQWYPLHRWHKNVGEVLIELTFNSNLSTQQFGGQYGGMPTLYDPFKASPYLGNHISATLPPQAGYQQPYYAQTGFQQQPVYQQQPMYQQQPLIQQQPLVQQQPMYQQQPLIQQQPLVQQQPMYQQQPLIQQQPMYQQPLVQAQPGLQQQVYQQPGFAQPMYGQPRPY